MLIDSSATRRDDPAQTIEHATFEKQSLHALKSDLIDFASQTKHRLASLSDSLRKSRQPHPAVSTEPPPCNVPSDPGCLPDVINEPVSSIDRGRKASPAVPPGKTQELPSGDDTDPMERLNAIKRRLEQQMQSTL